MRLPWRLLVTLAVVTPLFLGCGKRGPLRPLGESLPLAPTQVQVLQHGATLELSWSAPDKDEDGSPAQVAGFRIYRLPFLPGEECPECRDDKWLWRELSVTDGRDALRLYDDQVVAGQGYRYRIEPLTVDGFPGSSAQVNRVVVAAPPLPSALVATAGHALVTLSWDAPAAIPGGELLGYHLQRAAGEAPFAPQPLNRTPLVETTYEDVGLTNGVTYRYRVGALWRWGDVVVESDWTKGVSVTPQSAFR
ncbi:MAG: fibronectin type III domain-containing protein [Desulfuromonadaceae bacterium]|nr:fibronectin type III domain-containing protein [Desulfuromonadaceae bacterium]